MAKDTAVRVDLTEKIVKSLDFARPVVGVGPNGEPVHGKLKKAGKGTGSSTPKDWVLRDKKTPGFMVRVYPSKTVYQVQRKMTLRVDAIGAAKSAPIKRVIGTVGEIPLADARRTAQDWLGQMAKGLDPHFTLRKEAMAQVKEKAKQALTFGVFYEAHAKSDGGVKPETVKDRQKVVAWMERSPMWRVPIHELAFDAIDKSLSPLFKAALGQGKKPAWGPKSPGLASAWKIYRHTSAAYSAFVGQQGVAFARGTSPFATVRKQRKWPEVKARSTYLDTEQQSNIDWLIRLVKMRDDKQATLAVFADFLLLALTWGGRRRETQLLRWDHLDLAKGIGTFVGANTKSGKDHYFPITPWAMEILKARKERNAAWGRDYGWVFPSTHHDKPIADHSAALEELKKETGVWLTAHDLRRTVATQTAELTGTDSLMVSLTLAHSGGNAATTQRYIQSRVKLLRPIFEERERQLRQLAGLKTMEVKSSAIDTLIEFLEAAKKDPAERTRVMKRAEGILMMLQ